ARRDPGARAHRDRGRRRADLAAHRTAPRGTTRERGGLMSTTRNALTEVSCRECGTVTAVSVTGRTASDFCPSCDYPLFWAGSGGAAVSEAGSAADALRRAPGTSGSVTSSSLTCPECGEKNPSTGVT